MPFLSEAQRKFMWQHHPEIAQRWAKEYPDHQNLPEHDAKEKPKEQKSD